MDNLISSFDHALNEQKKPLFVFDIDSTIFNVSPRNQAIFDLFRTLNMKKNEELLKFDPKLKLTAEDWGLDPYTDHLGGEDSLLRKKALKFWRKHFFAGTFLHTDKPYPYATQWIKKLAERGASIKYLTGRDNHRMRTGTLAQLKHWGLPLIKDSDLITKPQKGLKDGPYKRDALKKLIGDFKGSKIFFLDNEPAVLDHCLFPEEKNYKIIYIESTHSSRSTPQSDWVTLNAFEYESLFNNFCD
jgi:hypothetical protein